jgi:hypothetical protein
MAERVNRYKLNKLWMRRALPIVASALLLTPASALAKTATMKEEPAAPPMELTSPPWQIDDGPNVPFNSIFAASAEEAWAVGGESIAEWNGSQWKLVPGATLGSSIAPDLRGVSGSGPDDVWAVGEKQDPANDGALIEHWNGTSWTAAAPATGEPAGSALVAVSADSPSDAWAVGSDTKGAMIEHWNGSSWSVVKGAKKTPKAEGIKSVGLIAVDALSPTDVWAIGSTDVHQEQGAKKQFVEHFNGSEWSIVKAVKPNAGGGRLAAISGSSPENVWAVGESAATAIQHWNGEEWSAVPERELPAGTTALTGIAALSATDVWAVGRGITEHFNGTSWSVVPFASSNTSDFIDVAGTPGGPLFALSTDVSVDPEAEAAILQQPAP